MADNSKYEPGFDLYQGNDITSWQAAAQSFKFLYVRASIGAVNDGRFVQYIQNGKASGMQVGAYIEQWPGTPIAWQVSTIQQQIKSSGVIMDLPSAIAYEQQSILDPKTKKYLPTFPGAGEFDGLYKAMKMVMPTCGYIGLAGLAVLKDGGLSLNSYDWWIARYYWSQGLMGEMSVDDTVNYLMATYGIIRDRILFIQTADSIGYPSSAISSDKGCDWDRAVSWSFGTTPLPLPTPQPVPASIQDIEIKVQDNQLQSVVVDGIDETHVSHLTIGTTPLPPPAPNPQPTTPPVQSDIFYYIIKTHIITNELTTAEKTTPAVMRIEDKPIDDWPNAAGRKGQWTDVTDDRRAFVVSLNPDPRGSRYVNDSVGAMLINTPGHVESIDCQHNILSGPGIMQNNAHKLNCFQSDENLRKFIGAVTFESRPDVIFKCLAEDINGIFSKVGAAIDAYAPLVARAKSQGGTGELWIGKEYVEPFPALPVNVMVTDQSGLNIHSVPSFDPSTVKAAYSVGETITLYAYRPIGASVFGQTDKGWICLVDRRSGPTGIFYTSWHIDTDGVIP